MNPGGVRQALGYGVASCLSLAVLIGVATLSVTVGAPASNAEQTATASKAASLLVPAEHFGQPLRALPVRSEADPLKDTVVDGVVDPWKLNALIQQQAELLGVDGVLLDIDSWDGVDLKNGDIAKSIPYDYLEIQWLLNAELDYEVVASDPSLLVDLTAALIVADAHGLNKRGLQTAQALLQLLEPDQSTCELDLQLLFAYSIGQDPPVAGLVPLAERAAGTCREEPTARWILAQAGARLSLDEWSFCGRECSDIAMEQFEAIRRDFPDSALGYAGEADFLLDRAEWAEVAGSRPFEVRAWRSRALSLYQQTRAVSDDPGLIPGHARALLKLGRTDEAVQVFEEMPAQLRSRRDAAVARVLIGQRQHDWDGVVETILSATLPDPLLILGSASAQTPAYAMEGDSWTGMWDATSDESGGADALDVAFVPVFRGVHDSTGCFESDLTEALWLGGRKLEAPLLVDELPLPMRCLEIGQTITEVDYDQGQDLMRWAGDYAGAEAVLDEWEREYPQDFAVPQRRGELAYLRGDYKESAALFQRAWGLVKTQIDPDDDWQYFDTLVNVSLDVVQPPVMLPLQQSAAEIAADLPGSALESLQAATLGLRREDSEETDPDAERFYIESQRGALRLAEGDYEAAVEHYTAAIRLGEYAPGGSFAPVADHVGNVAPGLLRGAQENNLALALSQLDRDDEAVEAARAALSRDTASPIFLDTLAYTLQRAERGAEAADVYREVLAEDSSSYVSAANLAVLLVADGDAEGAYELLTAAVATQPMYALGWHNLGVVAMLRDPWAIVESERAFATAARLDRTLRGEPAQMQFDEVIYRSNLDISKPLSPEWSFGESVRLPNRFTWTMAFLLVIQVGWALGLGQIVESAGSRILRGRLAARPGIRRVPGLMVTVALVVAVAALGLSPVLSTAGWPRALLYAVACLAVVLLPWGTRALVGRGRVVHDVSLPAVGIGAVGIPFGVGFAPAPGVWPKVGGGAREWVLWSAAATAGCLAGVFTVLTALTGAPSARIVAIAAISLLGAMMLPFRPFDGAWLRNRKLAVLIAFGLGLLTVGFGLLLF